MAKGGTGGIVLLTLATGQFLMALDSSVMNVSIATVAADVGTDVTGIQTAITAYTLVMAALMITGGTVGRRLGLRRAFMVGCVIYSCGSLTTSLAPNLGILLLGWSLLEGLGAVLILPAIVGLVAANFEPAARPRAYGLVASAAAIAIAVGPLVGGVVTTNWSWRWVFAGEVVFVIAIVFLGRRFADVPPDTDVEIDLVATALSGTGLALVVFGVLRSGVWGWVRPTDSGPVWLGLSPVAWLLLAGVLILRIFLAREQRRADEGLTPFLDPALLRIPQLRDSLGNFGFQFFVQMGLFFCVPLYLSIALGLSAAETGVRLLPLSLSLLLAAAGIPRFRPTASPRRVVVGGMAALTLAVIALIAGLDAGSGPEVVTVPLLIAGLGMGAILSQLGAVAVSAVPEERTNEVGGIQNTVTNLGSSLGTALAGSVLVTGLTAAFLSGLAGNPDVPDDVAQSADTQLAAGVPFVSDADLEDALDRAGVDDDTAAAIQDDYETSRIAGLRAALFVLAIAAVVGTLFARRLPSEPVGSPVATAPAADP